MQGKQQEALRVSEGGGVRWLLVQGKQQEALRVCLCVGGWHACPVLFVCVGGGIHALSLWTSVERGGGGSPDTSITQNPMSCG